MMATTKITVSPPSAGGSYGGRNEKASLDQDRAGGGGNEAGTKSASPEETSHKKEKLMVALRIRPLKYEEKARGNKCVAEKVDDRMILLLDGSSGKRSQGPPPRNTLGKHRSNERQYVFDMTFGADSTQKEVYEKTTQPLVKSVLEGFHATVFAYGATGAGKTFTMVGTPEHPGCMARALNELFQTMEQTATEFVFKVTLSYLEIYNENIRDLLNPSSGHLELRDDSRGKNITVAGLSEYAAKNTEEVMKLLQKGNKERTQEPTAANKTSSRSHALLMVNVKQTAKSRAQTRGAVKFGRLYMIDLAGSERASQTENRGKRLKEGAHINRSLLALGNVINALAEHKARGHVNFRDSKLTRLLKEALSGNCYTVMIAHISPADKHREESRNTLVYADRAKNISCKVRKNVLDVSYHISQYQTIISDLRGEIGRLKEKMVFEQNSGQPGASSGTKKAELQELREHMVVNFKDQMSLRQRLMEIDNHILGLSMEFERQNIIINEYETEKAKHIHDRNWRKRRSQSAKKSTNRPKSGEQQPQQEEDADKREDEDKDEEEEEAYEGDKEESGFEDNGSATNNSDDEEDQLDQGKSSSKEEDDPEPDDKETRSIADSSKDSDDDEDAEEEEEPEEVKQAWDELLLVQREQQRYSDIKYDLEQDLERCKKKQNKLEDELPKRISTEEEAEILQLLCKVHELEIAKVEMQRDAILKEHEVRKRDLLILKYDKQRTLCDEIIDRQKELIEALESNKVNGKSGDVGGGQALPMPPELMELYNLYKQELETRSTKENQFVEELDNQIIRAPSMISLRGGGPASLNHLPPIRGEMSTEERLFQSRENLREIDEEYGPQSLGINRTGSQLSLRSPNSSGNEGDDRSSLPPINGSSAASRHSSSRLSRSAEAASRQPSRYRNSGRSGIPVPVTRRKKSLPPSSSPTSPRRPSHAPSRGPSRSRTLTRSTSETPPTRLPPISRF